MPSSEIARDRVVVASRWAKEVAGAGSVGEDFGDVERLRQEALDLPRALHDQLVLLAKLVHAEDGDDVLELLVALQDLLHLPRHVVVLLADHGGRKEARRGVERIDGRKDRHLGDRSAEHGGRVQMGERGGGCGVGQVVGWHVDRLHRGDRTLLGRGDALLQGAHVGGQRRLVAHRRGDAAEERRHLGARLGEAEDVVHEEQHVLSFLVAEIFCQR